MNDRKNKTELKGLTIEQLNDYFESIGEQKFRGEQVFDWIYNHLEFNFDGMLNLSKELREKINETCSLNSLELITTQKSNSTGTAKYLFRTFDDYDIESVVIPEKNRNTLCISTQVGCPLDCKFCATGLMGYKRNLTAGEIVDQYLLIAKEYGKENISNIVYMGMGEPLINFDHTLNSLQVFTGNPEQGFSKNRITVSTSGIPNKIKELADSGLKVKLALSLHSCFEETRTLIMPINGKYSLADNFNAIEYYAQITGTKITFEYTMLSGINDQDKDIKALTKLSRRIPSKINLIPFNSIKHMDPGGISAELEPTSYDNIVTFADKLKENKLTVMLRDTQGDDIAAACGQLAVNN